MATKKVTPKNPETKAQTEAKGDAKTTERKTATLKSHRKTGSAHGRF